MKKNMFPDKKSKGKYFLLSIVALVEILVLLAVSTYAWVETVSTIRIYTSDSAVAKVDANPTGQLLTHNFQKATFSSTAADPIDLSQMYHESGAFHLAPASSADGKTIFFPHYQPDGSVNDYRKADSSDNMVNYVSFSFRVAAAGYYVFDADPTISFGGTAVDSNSTLVRLSLQVGEGTPAIFSKGASSSGETAVSSITGEPPASTNVRAFSSYTGGNGKYALHTTEANQIVTVRLWIQDPTHDSSDTYSGKQLSISNLTLVPAYKVTTYVTLNKTAATSSTHASAAAGTVKSGSATASWSSTAYVKHGSSVTLKATNSDSSTYTFKGWGTAANSTSYENTNLSYSKTNVTSAITRYAHFTTKFSITAKAVLGTDTSASTTYGTVQVGSATAGATSSSTVDYDGSVTLTATPTADYAIIGWYKGTPSDSTFVSGSNGKTSITVNNVTADATYYCSFKLKKTTTIYFMDRGYSDTYAYVVGSSTDYKYSGAWPGTKMTLDKTRGLYKFEFPSAEDENVQVIVNNGSGTQYPASGQNGLSATIGNTYLFKCGSPSSLESFTLGDKKFVYFSNNKGWTNLHIWDDKSGTSWPGNEMTAAYLTDGEQKYYRQIQTDSLFIFNNNGNGANQTVNLYGSASECRYYLKDEYDNGHRKVGTW